MNHSLPCLLIALAVCTCSCASNVEQASAPNQEMREGKQMELDAIRTALLAFIEHNAGVPQLKQFRLNKESLAGQPQQQGAGVWFLGSWVIEKSDQGLVAHYSVDYAGGDATRLILKIRQNGTAYSVSSWDIEETF